MLCYHNYYCVLIPITAYNLVSNEYLLKVSRKVDFQDIVRALDVSTVDAIEIENLKSTNQQRVFEVLDRWRRRGSKGQRGLGELYQVIALIGGKTHLVDDIMKIEEGKSHLKLFFVICFYTSRLTHKA